MFGAKDSKTNRYQKRLLKSKWTDYKIFKLKYGNTKLLGNTKYNQVKLVLAVFLSAYLYQCSSKLY